MNIFMLQYISNKISGKPQGGIQMKNRTAESKETYFTNVIRIICSIILVVIFFVITR